jgi:hypothetical protein
MSEREAIVKMLHELGYMGRLFGEESVESSASGIKFLIIPYANKTVQLRGGYHAKGSVTLEALNEHNSNYRFSKVYLDEEGDIVYEADFIFDLTADQPDDALFQRILNIWEAGLPLIQKLLED